MLDPDEPAPFVLENTGGGSPWLLTCEHGGRRLPRALGDLGLPAAAFERHIAWDIGALGVARSLARALDAELVHQPYSRLVVDCNRPPTRPSFIPEISEATVIPGNLGLAPEARLAREKAIWRPFQDAVAEAVGGRAGLLAIHSFTPVYKEQVRPWQLGFLHARAERLALDLQRWFAAEAQIEAALNEPYCVDADDYTIPVHGDARGRPAVLVEIRQDLIADAAGQGEWVDRLAPMLDAINRQPDIHVARHFGSRTGPVEPWRP
ncbi:MAG: N-formylglutamate amidohydrolase [Geminicoccaceae bacterium]|nr:N-formylglutamate amidohydrolase [Geminicoccaceae bacterium]